MQAARNKPSRTGWRAVAQRFVLVFVPLYLLVGAIVAAIYGVQFRADQVMLRSKLVNHIGLQSEMGNYV